jgi:CheY-like chemotaxis protein
VISLYCVKLHFIEPDKPIQNAHIESFNGRLRDECLNTEWFGTLREAQQIIEKWREEDNQQRPHSALGHLPPANLTATNDANSSGIPFSCPDELQDLHVLVVGDDEDSRRLVRTVLESCEAQLTTAANAADALLALQSLRPDVLVSDRGMPGEDGYSLIRKVRAQSPEQGGHIPAAALTAYARVSHHLKVLLSGFQIHLPKPVEPEELVAVVANLAKRLRD